MKDPSLPPPPPPPRPPVIRRVHQTPSPILRQRRQRPLSRSSFSQPDLRVSWASTSYASTSCDTSVASSDDYGSSQYTASDQSSSVDSCEISISSASYDQDTEHVFVGQSSGRNENTMLNRMPSFRTEKSKMEKKRTSRFNKDPSISSSTQRRKDKRKQDKKTPVISNRKQIDERSIQTGSSSNLFLQMGDNEVGNHPTDESTEQMSTSVSDYSPSSPDRGSVLGRFASGLKFHPAVGGSSMSSYASTTDNSSGHYPVPFTTPARGRKASETKNVSPTSVIPKGGTRPPRNKSSNRNQHPSLQQDSSYDDSEPLADDEATNERDVDYQGFDNHTHSTGGVTPPGLFGGPLDKVQDLVQDFILGNSCWSGGKEVIGKIKKIQAGCADFLEEEDQTLTTGSTGSTSGSGWEGTESEISGENNRKKKKKKRGKKMSRKEAKRSQKQQHADSQSKSLRNSGRGRSPTTRQGYNSDGETLTTGSPRGTSQSLSTRNSSSASGRSRSQGDAITGKLTPTTSNKYLEEESAHGSFTSSMPDSSVEVESASVLESVLTQDQEAWMGMTQGSVNNGGNGGGSGSPHASDNALLLGESAFVQVEGSVEGYFKKLLTVGVQLFLSDPSATNGKMGLRSGQLFLQFGAQSSGRYEQPNLVWTDRQDVSYAIELLDIQSIREPTPFELETYQLAAPALNFFLITNNGTSFLFEAVDEVQRTRVVEALHSIVSRLARMLVMGNNRLVMQMLLASAGGPGMKEDVVAEVPNAMADITDGLVKSTTLMQQAQDKLRSTRGRRNKLLRSRGDI